VTGRPADARLQAHLEVLRLCLHAYLVRLRAAWTRSPGEGGGAEIEGVLAAVGLRADPARAEVDSVRELVEQARAERRGPLAAIVESLGLELGEECLVAAAWWADADPQLAVALGCGHDDAGRRHASAPLLRLLLGPFGVTVPPVVDDHGPLVRFGVLESAAGGAEALRLTPTARLVLGEAPVAPLPDVTPLPPRLAGARAGLAAHLAAGPTGPVVLRGPAGAGKAALARAAALDAGLVPLGSGRPVAELRLLARLRSAVPVLPAEEAAQAGWTAGDGPLVALTTERSAAIAGYVVDVPAPTRAERVSAWQRALAELRVQASSEQVQAMSARFAFTEGDIAETVARARADAAWRRRGIDVDAVWAAARRQPEHALDRLAALVRPAFTLDDLVLTEEAHEKLRELVAHVDLQHVVLDGWGFRRRLPRGQGVVALFAGPPGTGKTMAAEAISAELRQDLYRIDLSAVVSKYIGETEKNLAAAFDEAERASAVLFFDEADALFGKRTEIRDAHDRYANVEVNYLLQRVETFTGLVILATNRQAALDEAFLRRLRFVIRFEPPDRDFRRALWRRSFPREAELGDLDWDSLATAELTGGNIQSAALAAAYLAAANGGVVAAEHVEHALRREYEKLGKAWTGLSAGGAG
jgi:AAA+ superfamily predicted ATPase